MMSDPNELVAERKATHGDWNLQAKCARSLHRIIHNTEQTREEGLTASQREALDMIATKISRILCGNPNEPDHWLDIQGYALLGMGGHKT